MTEDPSHRDVREAMARSAVRGVALSGHPDVSWSIVLDAILAERVESRVASERVASAFEGRPDLGRVPEAYRIESGGLERCIREFGDRRYAPSEPLVRIALTGEPVPHVILAAHHSVLDGLGLLALLASVLDASVQSGVQGLGPDRPAKRFLSTAGIRTMESLVQPAAAIKGRAGSARAPGDHYVRRSWAGPGPTTSDLISATARAVSRWNGSRSSAGRGIVVTVGASLRSGSHAGLEDGSAYLRLELKEWSASRVREALRSAPREPSSPGSRLAAGLSAAARPLATALSRRMGSTALVSSLGRVSAPSQVHQLAFFPVAHGRSGVALGMATVQDVTVITWRCRRSSFSARAAEELADVVLGQLEGGLGGLKQPGEAERSPPDGGLGGLKQPGEVERGHPRHGARAQRQSRRRPR